MNILLLTDKLAMGGAEIYYCKLENNLVHPEITFYFAAADGKLYERIRRKEKLTLLSRDQHLKNIKKLARLIQEKEIELIHANSLRMVLYSILIKKLIGRPLKVIYTKHNITVLERKFNQSFKYLLNKHVDKVITVSDFEKENLLKQGIDSKKIKTIYNGVDLGQFLFHQINNEESFKIGILARLSEEKNHELFINIADELRYHPQLEFYIAGDGPEKESITRKIRDLDLSEKVMMIGEVHNPEEFIKEMDVILLTSHREVFPMVVIESMAVGTPVLSIDKGGIKEAVNHCETGVLISQHCPKEFSSHILNLKTNPQFRMKLINQARKKVEKDFSLEQMIQQTLAEYLTFG